MGWQQRTKGRKVGSGRVSLVCSDRGHGRFTTDPGARQQLGAMFSDEDSGRGRPGEGREALIRDAITHPEVWSAGREQERRGDRVSEA